MNHVGRWRDVADLVAQHLDTPRVRRLVDLAHDGVIERIALREGLAQVELADLRTHGRLRQIDGGPPVVLDAVAGALRIDHPEIDETVHGDLHVVAGDAGLARHVDHLLAHLMAVGDAIEEWDQDVEPRLQDLAELTETLDHKGVPHGDDARGLPQKHERNEKQDRQEGQHAYRPPFPNTTCSDYLPDGAAASPVSGSTAGVTTQRMPSR